MKSEKLTKSLKEQSAWLLAAKVIGFLFSFALPLLIVRYLSQDAVGHYRMAFQVITNAVIILPLGFSMSAFYYLSREKERRGKAIANILAFNFVIGAMAALILTLFPDLIGNVFRSPEMSELSPLIGVVIWVSIFAAFLETAAVANAEAKVATYFIIFSSLSKTLLMGGAVLIFSSVPAFIYAAMIQAGIQTFVLLVYLSSRFPGFWRSFDWRFFIEQARYAVPFGLTGILWLAQNDIHNYFVAYKFTPADFAVYAYGCFQLPLIAMLSESVSSVLIPHMNTLQQADDRDEMIRLTARAMQKLAFVYFPLYVFLMVTAGTFIVTLFTHQYDDSTPIFMINLTMIPFGVLITDPIVRSYKELGRFFLIARLFVFSLLVGVLYFGLDQLGLVGMISVAVGALILEKIITETMIIRKLGVGLRHLALLTNVGKTALISLGAGAITYLVYSNIHVYVELAAEHFVESTFQTSQLSILNFVGGSLVLLISAAVFAPVYLIAAHLWGVIEDSEKELIKRYLHRLVPRRPLPAVADTQG